MKLSVKSCSPSSEGIFWRAGIRFTREAQVVEVTDQQAAAILAEPNLVAVEVASDAAPTQTEATTKKK